MKKSLSSFAVILTAVILAGCAGTPSESVVHEKAWRPDPRKGRAIVICLDGTANTPTDRTSVRRIFDLIGIYHDPKVLCYYDPGVGTGACHRLLGLTVGAGHAENVREAAAFAATHYQPGDHIYIVGFSRGSYAALDLCGFLRECGLPQPITPRPEEVPNFDKNTYIAAWDRETQARYREANANAGALWQIYQNGVPAASSAKSKASGVAGLRAAMAPGDKARLVSWWDDHEARGHVQNGTAWAPGVRPRQIRGGGLPIEGLALWDPVGAVGNQAVTAVLDSASVEKRMLAGHKHHNLALGPEIRRAYFALALDEHRSAFSPSLPPHPAAVRAAHIPLPDNNPANLLPSKEVEFVWFVGDHSDLGGGHSQSKDLAGLSLNWMLRKFGPDLFPLLPRVHVSESAFGPRHDLKITSGLWNLANDRVRREMFNDADLNDPTAAFLPRGMNAEGWKMKLHSSVLKRMREGEAHGLGHYVPLPFQDTAYQYRRDPAERDPVPKGTLEKFPVVD